MNGEPEGLWKPGQPEHEPVARHDLEDRRRIAVSLDWKIQPASFESASVGIHLSGIPAGADPALINEMLDSGKIAYDIMRDRIKEQIAEVRRKQGFDADY